jgi:hypothetical protein
MTVAELIEHLKQFDPNMRVVVDGYEGGFDDPKISETDAIIDANWVMVDTGNKIMGKKHNWNGRHNWGDCWTEQHNTRVILVGR